MTTFSDLKLDPKVLQAVTEAGYEKPTPIQEQAIPYALEGRDVLGIAQTGTGKTASFVLPMITMLAKGRARARMPRSLVLCPTRELAAQVAENFEAYAKHMKLSMALLIGGVSFGDQDKLIDRGVDVLIATPGRLLDHFERGKLMLTGVQIMVVDEADRMLDMGFIPDIEKIFKLTPFTRQTLFFSATMAPEITRVTNEFLSNPVRVEVARQATTSETIEQGVVIHKPRRKDMTFKDKREILRMLIEAEGEKLTNAIIFCNRKRDVDIVTKSMKKHGFDADAIHGDLDQSIRTRILESFRDGKLKLLVASDVAARGLDIPSVSHVFNFDMPTHSEDYVHRIGRTGRAGREGKALSICVPSDEKYLSAIEELVKKEIRRIESPLKFDTSKKDTGKDSDKDSNKDRETTNNSRQDNSSKPDTRQNNTNSRPPKQSQPRRGRRDDVVGMGDHVPAFMLIDLSKALSAAGKDEAEEKPQSTRKTKAEKEADDQVMNDAEATEEKPKTTRSRKKKPDAELAASADEKPKKTTRSRKKKVDSEADAGAETTQSTDADSPEAAEKPKRKRAPRKKKVEELAAEAEADAPTPPPVD